MVKISAVILTRDERTYFLKECIDAALQICDEVVICDTSPEAPLDAVWIDKTYENDKRIRIIYCAWRNEQSYTPIRNWACSFATGDWILNLDADEILGDNSFLLHQAIRDRPDVDCFSIPGIHFIYTLTYIDAQTEKHVWRSRLFKNNGKIKYNEQKGMHGLPEGYINTVEITTQYPVIFHLGYIKDQVCKVFRQYTQNKNSLEIHTNEYLDMWVKSHITGTFPVKAYNGPYPSILKIGNILNIDTLSDKALRKQQEKQENIIEDGTNTTTATNK